MSNLPYPITEDIQIYSNEFVTNVTVNRSASRLLSNDLWLESTVGEISSDYLLDRVGRVEFDTLSADVDNLTESSVNWDSTYSTVNSYSATWDLSYFNDSCSYYHNTTVSLADGVATTITYDIQMYDINAEFAAGIFTYAESAGVTGYFLVRAGLRLPGSTFSSTDDARLILVKNSTNYAVLDVQYGASVAKDIYLNGSAIIPLVNGDTIRVKCLQNSGGAVSFTADTTANMIMIQRLK